VEILVVELADGANGKNEMYHIVYDGSIEDERNYAAMGGQAEEIRRFLKEHYRDELPLAEAVRLGIRALTVTQNKTLTDRDLEVAVLDRKRARRKFRRIANGELRAILGRPDPPEGGRPMGTS
jgi:proteasome alpha subunit